MKGLFHEMVCADCGGAGLVHGDTGEAIAAEQLVVQLRLRLNKAMAVVREQERLIKGAGITGAEQDYGRTNGRGPGGSNYTGD